MRFEEVFKTVLLEYLHQNGVPEATEVTHWEEDSYVRTGGCCDTCAWSETVITVHIHYRTPDMTPRVSWREGDRDKRYTYEGSFTSLLQDLVEIGDRMEVDARNEDSSC